MEAKDAAPNSSGEDIEVAFLFLESDGFEAHVSEDGVSYRKPNLCIEISRDPRDCDVDIRFHRDSDPSLTFGFRHAAEVSGKGDSWPNHGWSAPKRETFHKYLAELAMILERTLPALQGNLELQVKAHQLRSGEADKRVERLLIRQTRKKASDAWQSMDWFSVVAAYTELTKLGAPLSTSERKKLSLATRHLKDENSS